MSGRTRARRASMGAAAVLMTALVGIHPAAAASDEQLSGSAAATDIDVLNGTVTSGPTSASTLTTNDVGQSSTNRLASVDVAGLIRATTLATDVTTSPIPGGKRITSTAQAAGVQLLGGAIKLKAITTTGSVSLVDGIASFAGDTEILGLTIGGRTLPVALKPNTKITIPGLAEVVINKVDGKNTSDAAAMVNATGIEVTLLKPVRNAPAGATILVTPTTASGGPFGPSEGPLLGGLGYALKASAHVAGSVNILAGPVAAHYVPLGGTAGREDQRSTAGVNLPIAKASALGTTVQGSRKPSGSSATVTAHAAKVNLLGGVITADVIESRATASREKGASAASSSGSSRLVGLRIGGAAIPVEVPPNTKIRLPNLATVTVNEQTTMPNGIRVRALHVVVTAGKLAGIDLEVSTALVTAGS